MNRWWTVVGGVSMNLALGSLYAWSVFVIPLEEEFGWTRGETSWVFTIAIATFAASFVLGGRIQDRRGPQVCAATGAILVGIGFVLASFTTSLFYLYNHFRFHRWPRKRDLATQHLFPLGQNGSLTSEDLLLA